MGRVIAIVIVACARAVFAQPTDPAEVPSAGALFEAGRELLIANRPAEACAKFEAALARDRDAIGPLMNLGLCNEQLDKLATAKRWFGRAKQRARELGLSTTIAAADAKLDALVPHVPALAIAFAPNRPAAVTIDGSPIAGERLGHIEVDAGHHIIETATIRREVDARDGEVTPVTISLDRRATPPIVTTSHRGAYIAAGVGAGLLAGTLVVSLIGRHEYRTATTNAELDDWKTGVRYGCTSAFVAGLAALGLGVWLYVSAPTHMVFVPVADEHGAGAQLSVTF